SPDTWPSLSALPPVCRFGIARLRPPSVGRQMLRGLSRAQHLRRGGFGQKGCLRGLSLRARRFFSGKPAWKQRCYSFTDLINSVVKLIVHCALIPAAVKLASRWRRRAGVENVETGRGARLTRRQDAYATWRPQQNRFSFVADGALLRQANEEETCY